MPTGPKGQKRPADAIGRAVRIAQIATGEVEESPKKKAISVGSLGGKARAEKLDAEQRKKIARKAASARWAKED